MVLANLVYRPIRSLISIVAIAVEVTLILVIVGLSIGMLNDSANRQRGIGADLMIQPPGGSYFAGVSGAPMSIKIADVLRRLPHVAVVSPVVQQLNTAGAVEVISGIDMASYEALGGPFRYLEGGPFEKQDDILVDEYFARSNHVRAGDMLETLNHRTRVAGIVEQGKGARKFLQIGTLQDWTDSKGKVSVFYVKCDDPKNTNLVKQEILQIPGMQGYGVRSMAEYLSLLTPEKTPGLSTFIKVVIGVAVIIGFIVIFQAMYTAVMERTREIGILKSLGASKLYIVNVILRETLLLTIFGILVGIAISYAASAGIRAKFPLLPILITSKWILYSTAVAVVGSLLGAIYPAIKAARKDPIDALAYE